MMALSQILATNSAYKHTVRVLCVHYCVHLVVNSLNKIRLLI